MYIIKTTIVLFISVILFTSSINEESSRGVKQFKFTPPGCVWLKNNLYIDSKEIQNTDYREYLFWLLKAKGRKSTEYIAAFPDTSVWQEKLHTKPLIEKYLRTVHYSSYPMVGVSYEQANNYCKWRTDIVNEYILIKKGIVENGFLEKGSENFTLKSFLDGTYKNILRKVKPEDNYLIARYRLPSKEEWEYAASADLDIKRYPLGFKKSIFSNSELASNTKNGNKEIKKLQFTATVPVSSYKTNKYKIYCMIGNVAEMTLTKGISKGGSWIHNTSDCEIRKEIKYEKPEKWLGFRCACELEQYKIKR